MEDIMSKSQMGIAGIFTDEHQTVEAAYKVREMVGEDFEAITPYPVHGMEEACGIPRSGIPYVTFIAGITGLTIGLTFTWWTSAVNWPINVGGKPFFSLPAFIPIIFELTILFAALSSVVAMFIKCGIPGKAQKPIDLDLTCHKFALFIPQSAKGFNEAKIEALLKTHGAVEVKKAEF
jgi:hypothetical protein